MGNRRDASHICSRWIRIPRLDSGQLPITLYCDIGISLDRGCQSIVFIKVNLVDAQGTKNVPGRRSDVLLGRWLN